MSEIATTDRRALRKAIASWSLFDFANTGFSVMIVTFGWPLFFNAVVADDGNGEMWWSYAISLSMLICALIAPPLGAAADVRGAKKTMLLLFTLLSVGATAALWFVQPGMVWLGILLFVVANVGFEGGIVFYDALLPSLASKENAGKISGYGFAMGYAGAMAILGLCFPLMAGGFGPDNIDTFRLAFPATALFFLVFALPLFFLVPEPPAPDKKRENWVALGIRRSVNTLLTIRRYPQISRFLLAFFLYNDAILTIIAFASVYAQKTLGFEVAELIAFFVIIQTTAIGGSLVFGPLTDKKGPKATLRITLVLWILVSVMAYFAVDKMTFYVVGVIAGIAIGSSQSASRAMMVRLTPKERSAEFFGFYDGFFGKTSAILGPLIFGLLSTLYSQRVAVVMLSVFFIAGLAVLRGLNDSSTDREVS